MAFRKGGFMDPTHRLLLTIDAFVNLLLGLALLLLPAGLIELLGLPPTSTHFYTSILGAVLVGIGLALLIEVRGEERGSRGLGLRGAIAINLCGAGVLVTWLLRGDLEMPRRGHLVLWLVALAVLAIAVAELMVRSGRSRGE